MPRTKCDNPECGTVGGRFTFQNGKWFCEKCAGNSTVFNSGADIWSFESMNISNDANKGPIQVQSLRHLRQLEKQHGVISTIANYDNGSMK